MYEYEWTLKDSHFTKDKGTVFSCFACGGGSTMGYKLAGFDVIGCNELDPRMMTLYEKNHHPKYAYCEPIQSFKDRQDLPAELFELDILDGSPPCSTFSLTGGRESTWGVKKKFREGQQAQVLDTLFFDFIDLAKRLQPKVVIAENVKGLLAGRAIDYVHRIYHDFNAAGYYCQHVLLKASAMGVPQRRERVFFLCLRKDLATPFLAPASLFEELPYINMTFNEKPIYANSIIDYNGRELNSPKMRLLWDNRQPNDKDQEEANIRLFGKNGNFNQVYIHPNKVCPTLTASSSFLHFDRPLYISRTEIVKIASFPQDYDFGRSPVQYVCGMSVPPVMMAQVANRIYEQWISKINQHESKSTHG